VMGAVAAGHPLTVNAAAEMLRMGGNAFDAVLAAGFASVVTEPALSGLGGGGFMLASKNQGKREVLYDFFVDVPGKGRDESREPCLIPIEIRFPATVQVFHIGEGSVAVPGLLHGFREIHRDLCSFGLDRIVSPVLGYLERGVELTPLQAGLLRTLREILGYTDYGKEIFDPDRDRLYNPLLRDFLSVLSWDGWFEWLHDAVREFEQTADQKGGVLTAEDIMTYRVHKRDPLRIPYREYTILTNPPPSFGGILLEVAFEYLRTVNLRGMSGTEKLLSRVSAMERMHRKKSLAGGTTHISVVDEEGNAASMTLSNGSNSGCFLGNTGIMLNNMMGEDDLHPGGFYTMPCGERVPSMMSPTIIKKGNEISGVLGSGGSKRIRTAMMQVMMNLIDEGMNIHDAVESPRLHLDDEGILQVEPGYSEEFLQALSEYYEVNVWKEKDIYFGGVHIVTGDLRGWGDSRRGGVFELVEENYNGFS